MHYIMQGFKDIQEYMNEMYISEGGGGGLGSKSDDPYYVMSLEADVSEITTEF